MRTAGFTTPDTSSYITLDDLATREGREFQVLDAKSNDDITHKWFRPRSSWMAARADDAPGRLPAPADLDVRRSRCRRWCRAISKHRWMRSARTTSKFREALKARLPAVPSQRLPSATSKCSKRRRVPSGPGRRTTRRTKRLPRFKAQLAELQQGRKAGVRGVALAQGLT